MIRINPNPLPTGARFGFIRYGGDKAKEKLSLERESRPGSVWEVLTKKMPATSAGTKLQNKEKPAVRELLTAGVVEMRGVEPLSESHLPALSTSVAGILHLPQDSAYRQALAFGSP